MQEKPMSNDLAAAPNPADEDDVWLQADEMEAADALEESTETEERVSVATQWQLMWWAFRRHRLAVFSAVVILLFYTAAALADFLAYADPHASAATRTLVPPQPIHLVDNGRIAPYVYALTGTRDPVTFQRVYRVDTARKIRVNFFAHGYPYKLLSLIHI